MKISFISTQTDAEDPVFIRLPLRASGKRVEKIKRLLEATTD